MNKYHTQTYLKLNVAENRLKMREGVVVQGYYIFRGPGVEFKYLKTLRTKNKSSLGVINLFV